METPTVSNKQRKSTLSAKKNKIKETIKNVIVTPYKNSYWPQILPEDQEMLEKILQKNLPRVKSTKVSIPWKVLKNIPKPDRKKFRNEYSKNDRLLVEKNEGGLTFGINDVAKNLENNVASTILISSDVKPRIMVQHIIDQAVLYSVPIIVFDGLRNLLFNVCGLSSAVISLNKNINSDSKLNVINESVNNIFKKCSPPVNHFNYNRLLKTSNSTEKPQGVEDKKIVCPVVTTEVEDEIKNSVYLKRESKDKRVFVPESSQESVTRYKMQVDSTGFLPFSEMSISKTASTNFENNYRSLTVKRLKGDPNRIKRKIQSIKRKNK